MYYDCFPLPTHDVPNVVRAHTVRTVKGKYTTDHHHVLYITLKV